MKNGRETSRMRFKKRTRDWRNKSSKLIMSERQKEDMMSFRGQLIRSRNAAGQNWTGSLKAIAPLCVPTHTHCFSQGVYAHTDRDIHTRHWSACPKGPFSSASRHVAEDQSMRKCCMCVYSVCRFVCVCSSQVLITFITFRKSQPVWTGWCYLL